MGSCSAPYESENEKNTVRIILILVKTHINKTSSIALDSERELVTCRNAISLSMFWAATVISSLCCEVRFEKASHGSFSHGSKIPIDPGKRMPPI